MQWKEKLGIIPQLMFKPDVERKILQIVEKDVRQIFTDPLVDPIHDIRHILMVVGYVKQISQGETQDPFVPTIAAWLHDVGRITEIKAKAEGRNVAHARASADQTLSLLATHSPPLQTETIYIIQDAVARHSDLNKDDDSLVAIYLKEADRLAGLGAVGIFRNVAESGQRHRHLINFDNPFPDGPINPRRFREPDASAIEALLFISEWHQMFRTETGSNLARPLGVAMSRYLWQFACETDTRGACARNNIVQALSTDVPDLRAEINSFLI